MFIKKNWEGVKQRRYEKKKQITQRKNYPSAINNKLHIYKENEFEDREH